MSVIKNLIENKEYSEARKKISIILSDSPQSEIFYEAHLLLGKCLYYENEFRGALGELGLSTGWSADN